MLPDLLVLIGHFEGEDQDNTKLACAALANNMFGRKAHFVSCVTLRVLGAIKFYNKPRTMIACLKLFIAYAIKKKNKKTAPFLSGGVYAGCKSDVTLTHARDSLFLKDQEHQKSITK